MDDAKTVLRYWETLCRQLEVTSLTWTHSKFWDIYNAYMDPKRKYHDLGHIAYGLRMIDTYEHLAEDPVALRYAWIHHDIIYPLGEHPAGLPTNEALSAVVADQTLTELNQKRFVRNPMSVAFRERVIGEINVTHHNELFPPNTQDEMLIADIDWSPMAAPWPEFLRNRGNIRFEYGRYSDDQFVEGRRAFISKIRDRKSHFHLPEFKDRFDAQAKQNIKYELELLKFPWEDQVKVMEGM